VIIAATSSAPAPESEARLKALVKAGKIDLVVPYQLHALEGAQGPS